MFDASNIGLFHECISLLKKKKNIFDFLKLSVNLNFLLQNRSNFFYIHTKNQFFTLFQNISDIFEPKDFVLLNKKDLIFFSSPKTFFFTYTKTYLIFLRPNQFFYYKIDLNCFSKEEDTLINRLM